MKQVKQQVLDQVFEQAEGRGIKKLPWLVYDLVFQHIRWPVSAQVYGQIGVHVSSQTLEDFNKKSR